MQKILPIILVFQNKCAGVGGREGKEGEGASGERRVQKREQTRDRQRARNGDGRC